MKNIKNKVKAIIFDMDGTIIDSEKIWDNAVRSIFTKRNITLFTPQQIKLVENMAGCGLYECTSLLKKEFNIATSENDLIQEIKFDAIKGFNNGILFINGFENFHRKLQQHLIPTSIATNADELSLKTISNKLNLHSFFGKNMYHIGNVENKGKPDPAIFLHAAKKLQVKPEECIVFEDSVFGFKAAKAANMKCIAVKNPKNLNLLHHVHGAINSYDEAEAEIIKICR